MSFLIKGPLFQKTTKVDIENQNQMKSSNTAKSNGNDVKQVREEKKNSPRTFSNLSPTSPTQIDVKHVSSKWS